MADGLISRLIQEFQHDPDYLRELLELEILEGTIEKKLCPRCGNLTLKLTEVYPAEPQEADHYMRTTIFYWKCTCGYGEYL